MQYIIDKVDECLNTIRSNMRSQASPPIILNQGRVANACIFEGHKTPHEVAAVDCGSVKLGEVREGLVIALRAALVIDHTDGTSETRLWRTGPLFLSYEHQAENLRKLGEQLGQADYYVEALKTDGHIPQTIRVKAGNNKPWHYTDRYRSWLEKLVQKEAASAIENGILLFDGALTARTRDCPARFLKSIISDALSHGNTVAALSKRSDLLIQTVPVRWWLDDAGGACYRELTNLIKGDSLSKARAYRVLGNVYVVRLSDIGPALRLDLRAAKGLSDREALDDLYSSCLMRCGFPDIAIRAHALCCFTPDAVWQLRCQARQGYGVFPEDDISFQSAFAPFAGRFK